MTASYWPCEVAFSLSLVVVVVSLSSRFVDGDNSDGSLGLMTLSVDNKKRLVESLMCAVDVVLELRYWNQD